MGLPLRFIKEGDIITRHTGARYRVYAVAQIETITYVVYKNLKGLYTKPKINSIAHLKEWGYEIEFQPAGGE